MDYNVQAKNLTIVAQYFEGTGIPDDYVKKIYRGAESIADLLARAEAAEARCETLDKMVKEYQETIVPMFSRRAEKAEKERDAAVEEIPKICYYCKHRKGWKTCDDWNGKQEAESCGKWEWRGVKEE